MTTHVNDSGTWRQLTEIHVNDSGMWRKLIEAYVNDGGTWRLVFSGDLITLDDVSVVDLVSGPGTATATYRLESDGDILDISPGTTDIGDWIVPKVNMADYSVRFELVSGATPSGSALDTWLALTSNRDITVTRGSNGLTQSIVTVKIARTSDTSTVLDQATVTLEAEKEP